MSKFEKTIIELIDIFKNQNDIDIAFAGGVGIDGYLKRLTRKHNDIDIDAFGRLTRNKGSKIVETALKNYKPKFNGIYFELKINCIKIEIGYVRVVKEDKKSRKHTYDAGEGKFTISKPLSLINRGKINKTVFNIFNPSFTLAEKLMLPIIGNKKYRSCDLKDINNLLGRLPKNELQTALFERYKFRKNKVVDVGLP